MIPTQTFESYPVFGDNATKVAPDAAKYSNGFIEGDVYPAEWVNWAWAKNTKGITDANAGISSMEAEINSVLTGAGKTPDVSETNQLLLSIQKLISDAETRAKLAAHPIGSLYWSSQNTDPGTLFGGTWQRIKDTFIWAAGDSDTINATGGAKTVTLQTSEIPSHTHTFTGSEVTSGTNSRGHTHSVTASGSISGGAYKFTGTAATLKATAGGTISVTTNPTFTGSAVTSGAMSGNSAGSFSMRTVGGNNIVQAVTGNVSNDGISGSGYTGAGTSSTWGLGKVSINVAHTHSVTASGSISGGAYKFTGTEHSHSYTPAGSISITTNPGFTGSAVTSGGESQNHTHSVTASGSNASTGGGGAHNNMPPYTVKYCWERTA